MRAGTKIRFLKGKKLANDNIFSFFLIVGGVVGIEMSTGSANAEVIDWP
jgi:uncharacterized ion transporter superfamily protein YfcC